MIELVAAFVIGFAGSLHCLGMCGPIVLAYSLCLGNPGADGTSPNLQPWKNGFLHHLAFHSGRLVTYGLLGALSASLFYIADFPKLLFNVRGSMTLLGGVLMLLFSLAFLRVIPLSYISATVPLTSSSFFRQSFSALLRSQRVGSKTVLGLATGFLPCCLSWAMIAQAATTQNLAAGFFVMVSFGLGTIPALFLFGFSASIFSLRMRLIGERVAASAILIMGMILIIRGARALL